MEKMMKTGPNTTGAKRVRTFSKMDGITYFYPPRHVMNVPPERRVSLSFPGANHTNRLWWDRTNGRWRDHTNGRWEGAYVNRTNGHWEGAYALRHVNGTKVNEVVFGPRERYRMTNSCDGLVGVYGRNSFWIINPSIPRLAALPRCSPHVPRFRPRDKSYPHDMPCLAIGLPATTDAPQQYKVVRIYARKHKWRYLPVSLGCEVLTLEEGHFWKPVDDPPAFTIPMFSMPLVVDGIVYWTVRMGPSPYTVRIRKKMNMCEFERSAILLCFDLREDKFSLVYHPLEWGRRKEELGLEQGRTDDELVSRLYLMGGGRLCLVDRSYKKMTLWRLEDRERSEWVRLHDFDYSKYKDMCLPWYGERPLSCKYYYDMQASIADHNIDMATVRFLSSDTMDESGCEKLVYDGNCLMSYTAPYSETNIWPF